MTPQNMPQTLNSLLSSTNNKVAKSNQGQTWSETIIQPKWVYHLKICLKLQIHYYHPLNESLLGSTNVKHGKQGQTMMHILSCETIIHPKWM